MLVRPQPPDLDALVVKGKSHDSPKVEAQVRFLARVLTFIPGVWRRHAALRRRRYAGSTPAGDTVAEPKVAAGPGCDPGMCGFNSHRPPCNKPAKLNRPSAAFVKRTVWVRLPPLALRHSGVAQVGKS